MTLFPKPITGRHVLIGLIAFFAVMLSADFALIYFSLKTHPGVTSESAYRDGLAYNETLAAAAAQAGLGWDLATSTEWIGERELKLTLTARDADDRPLGDLTVTADFIRPVDDGMDQAVRLNATGPGRYQGIVALPARGNWRLDLLAEQDEERMRIVEALNLK